MIAPTHAAPPAFGPPLRCEPGQVLPVRLPELVATPAKLPSSAARPPAVLAGRPAVITPPLPTVWLPIPVQSGLRALAILCGGCRAVSWAAPRVEHRSSSRITGGVSH